PVGETDHIRGHVAAPITLVEYGNFESYYCALAYPMIRELLARFPYDLRFVFRHAPQTRFHANAERAAQAAEAAVAQRKFWRFHYRLFEHVRRRNWPHLVAEARTIGLDLDQFRADVESGRFRAVVHAFEHGGADTVRGIPIYFLDGVRYDGPSDLESLS